MADVPVVDFTGSEEQQMLRETTRKFLEDQAPSAVMRAIAESESGFDAQLWKAGASLGWHSLAIPEKYGGSGFTFVELSVVLEELGRALFPGPFLSTVVMAANAILLGGTETQKQELLPAIAAGESMMTMALFEEPHHETPGDISMAAVTDGEGWILDGVKSNVLFGTVATASIVAARTDAGLTLFLVPEGARGLTIEEVPTLDTTRRQATLRFDGVRVSPDALLGEEGAAGPVLERVLRLASVALSLEQVGGAQWCLDTAVEHAKTRYQFGRAIGSFQAVKHRCADMLMGVEHARSTAYHAARVTDDTHEMRIAAPLAKSICSEAFMTAAGETIQVLGGTGFTWEHDVHLYFKRAKSTSLMFGGIHHQRGLLSAAIGL